MRVTRANIKDAKEISDVYGVFYFVSIKDIENMIERIVVLKKQRKIIGLLATNKKKNSIKMLVVKGKEQGCGYGKLLFQDGSKILDLKKENMEITATESPTSSVDFWRKMGFKKKKSITTKRGNKMMIMIYKGGNEK